jgi:hypothetical protein
MATMRLDEDVALLEAWWKMSKGDEYVSSRLRQARCEVGCSQRSYGGCTAGGEGVDAITWACH